MLQSRMPSSEIAGRIEYLYVVSVPNEIICNCKRTSFLAQRNSSVLPSVPSKPKRGHDMMFAGQKNFHRQRQAGLECTANLCDRCTASSLPRYVLRLSW